MDHLNNVILSYREFLCKSWGIILEISKNDKYDSLISDWLQVNWELLVESNIDLNTVTLEPYGEGADVYGESSRVIFPEKIPNLKIKCTSKNMKIKDLLTNTVVSKGDYIFDRFVTTRNGWYNDNLPFDKVLCYKGNDEFVFNLDDIYFELVKA